ncbi:hypothetical protein [Streptomyces sp. 7N604]|uniref:hypothetical protein n=1 Tax=Streptomyces sp. 7N604 TaxID=3457415 RepID=UPI003FD563DF
MSMSAWGRVGVSVTAVAVLAGVAGCQDGADSSSKKSKNKTTGQQGRVQTPVQAITAAFKKTEAAKSAKVRMTMSLPVTAEGGGETVMTGVMGWDPTVMDMTMSGPMFKAEPGAPEKVRMVWRDNVMYMDMGAAAAKDMDGKRWMKLDLAAAAKASGGETAAKQMTGGLDSMNQDPAQQLAVLLESPNIRRVGVQQIDGQPTEHYKGTLTFEEMLKANKSGIGAKEREELLKKMRESKIKGYDTEVWVNEDDYPVKMDLGMKTPQGRLKVTAEYYDYGAPVEVQTPPDGETVDLFAMLKDMGETPAQSQS